jgi:hypothetical protein
MANVISMDKKVPVISALVEGCSVRSTSRMTGVSKGAILRLLVSIGTACSEYLNVTMRNVKAKRIQIDEIWSFVGCKQKNVTPEIAVTRVAGDVWTLLTNAFSKKIENHIHMLAVFHMYHNFARIHQALRVTPAMEAGISQHVWSIQEIVELSSHTLSIAA